MFFYCSYVNKTFLSLSSILLKQRVDNVCNNFGMIKICLSFALRAVSSCDSILVAPCKYFFILQ